MQNDEASPRKKIATDLRSEVMEFCEKDFSGLRVKFPTQRNREFLRRNREFEPGIVQSDLRMTFSEGTESSSSGNPPSTLGIGSGYGDGVP
jgi:hypothetical protein